MDRTMTDTTNTDNLNPAPPQDATAVDMVNYPPHYQGFTVNLDCINFTQYMDFCTGNAFKYVWRAGLKGESAEEEIQDLKKALWYLDKIHAPHCSSCTMITDIILYMSKFSLWKCLALCAILSERKYQARETINDRIKTLEGEA